MRMLDNIDLVDAPPAILSLRPSQNADALDALVWARSSPEMRRVVPTTVHSLPRLVKVEDKIEFAHITKVPVKHLQPNHAQHNGRFDKWSNRVNVPHKA